MRIVVILICTIIKLFAFELVLNTGRQDNEPFAILHLTNGLEFTCQQKDIEGTMYFECIIAGMVNNELQNQNFAAFDLTFNKEEQKITIIITPKMRARMFDLSQNIYQDKELSSSISHKSKGFTFVFTPFLDAVKQDNGLDFSIDFPHESLPYIGALDLNSEPVFIPQSADINTYIRIKNQFEKANYAQVAVDAQNAINRYKKSIFMSEFILYKLRAQAKLYTEDPSIRNQEILEQMIQEAKNWTRTYTSDKNFPEVLNIMLRTYIVLARRSDVDYIMSIVENEFADNYFAELSKLDYADYIYNLGEKERAVQMYENVYFGTKNLDLAARAAVLLAKNELLNTNIQRAMQYVQTILQANPKYFGKDIKKSLELAKLFADKKHFDTSANIYKNTFSVMPRINPDYEETLKNLALVLTQSSNPNEAEKYINLYKDEYFDGKYLTDINKASDEVFLFLGDNNASLLHKKYQDIFNRYLVQDENIAKKALNEDIKLYYKEGNISAILNRKNEIEKAQIPSASKFLEQAAVQTLKNQLQEDDCIQAVQTFNQFTSYDIGQKIDNKKQMLQCFQRTSRKEQALMYADKNFDEDSVFYGLQKANMLFDDKQYARVVDIAKNIANSKILKSEEEQFRAYYLQFVSYLKQGDYNQAVKILQILESFTPNFTLIESYVSLLNYANEHNMQTTILNYAPKAIDYQNLKGVNLFSPNLEFMYLEALQKESSYDESLSILQDLLKLRLSDEDRARALYIQSRVYEKIKDTQKQKESLKLCIELETNSSWQDLCRDKNQILQE
ncbi:flagellar protein [Campylobacter sp. MIT 21-1685]|uniref:tetratricopeptide repeat protein n=1 Tax=unclassified Campylobacter TaxID=2593542 RepID=UPI00224B4BD0|nr:MULTISPECIES: flagellar protein [unclassified Campylobacter]MCX2682656.1 flagellar protein [Campylobacter sp. MIT 21-1684]MCX2750936.1 flagellar protein [Campylobacter sp. MIT 21-1682]MCX2807131.1 flagellar protein [Campylobacter sp. MIT 21-1685]